MSSCNFPHPPISPSSLPFGYHALCLAGRQTFPEQAPCGSRAACHFLGSLTCSLPPQQVSTSIHLPRCFLLQFSAPTFHLLCLDAVAETEASHCLCCSLFGSVTAMLPQCSNFWFLQHGSSAHHSSLVPSGSPYETPSKHLITQLLSLPGHHNDLLHTATLGKAKATLLPFWTQLLFQMFSTCDSLSL